MTDAVAQEFLKRRAAQERVAAKLAKTEHAQQSHAEMARRYQDLAIRTFREIDRSEEGGLDQPIRPILQLRVTGPL
ncbi:MAG: hypothetical protein ABIO43_01825 [Sphingomicrobium sp.]